jgi:hypothetical protein
VYLSRFYLPFDSDCKLKGFLEKQFRNRVLVMLDVIFQECKLQSNGLVVKSLPFLESEKSIIVKTTELMVPAPKRFSNLLDNNFCVTLARKRLTNEQFTMHKQQFLESGDGKIIVFSLNKMHDPDLLDNEIIVLTDESSTPNDGKLFKKLPTICEFLHIKTITLVEYLKVNNIDIDWVVPERF